nr:ATP synthase F0 subunit a [Namystynia karyoxenos]
MRIIGVACYVTSIMVWSATMISLFVNVNVGGQQSFSVTYVLGAVVLLVAMLAVFSDNDLVVVGLVMLVTMALLFVGVVGLCVVWVRGGFFLGHLYVGSGLLVILRCALCYIELLSCSFRVVSLSLRLNSNMVAGHVLLGIVFGLLWCLLRAVPVVVGVIVAIVVLLVFVVLKLLTCTIQADVIVRLLRIYWAEYTV